VLNSQIHSKHAQLPVNLHIYQMVLLLLSSRGKKTTPLSFNCNSQTHFLAQKLSYIPDSTTLHGDIIADELNHGFIEEIELFNILEQWHFIPHHPIKKDSITTPTRIVYDCSCHQSPTQPSLIDCRLTIYQ